MRIRLSTSYLRALEKFIKNNKNRFDKVKKTLTIFKNNPNHPSLHLEKLSGSEFWTIRIDKGNRIFFSWIDKSTALFIDIGKHDKYRRY